MHAMKFTTWWDWQADVLMVKVTDDQGHVINKGFTKQYLEDTPTFKFMDEVKKMADSLKVLPSGVPPEQLAALLLPGIKAVWKAETNGTVKATGFAFGLEKFRIRVSQGFIMDLPTAILDAEEYHKIRFILVWLAQRWQGLIGIAAVDVPFANNGKDESVTVDLTWEPAALAAWKAAKAMQGPMNATAQAVGNFQTEIYKFAKKYNMNPKTIEKIFSQPSEVSADQYDNSYAAQDAKIAKEMAATSFAGVKADLQALKNQAMKEVLDAQAAVKAANTANDGKFHVLELGDQMWAPPEMMKPLHWTFHTPPVPNSGPWGTLKFQYSDDDFGIPAPTKYTNKIIIHSADKTKVEKVLYPGKVWLLDGDYDEDEKEMMKMIQKKTGMSSLNFGVYPQEQTKSGQIVSIPKKPKEVTKATLAHFHKLLGGFSIFP